jgi:hypothetical protein
MIVHTKSRPGQEAKECMTGDLPVITDFTDRWVQAREESSHDALGFVVSFLW